MIITNQQQQQQQQRQFDKCLRVANNSGKGGETQPFGMVLTMETTMVRGRRNRRKGGVVPPPAWDRAGC